MLLVLLVLLSVFSDISFSPCDPILLLRRSLFGDLFGDEVAPSLAASAAVTGSAADGGDVGGVLLGDCCCSALIFCLALSFFAAKSSCATSDSGGSNSWINLEASLGARICVSVSAFGEAARSYNLCSVNGSANLTFLVRWVVTVVVVAAVVAIVVAIECFLADSDCLIKGAFGTFGDLTLACPVLAPSVSLPSCPSCLVMAWEHNECVFVLLI